MLTLQSYKNFIGNTYYYQTLLGLTLANKLKIGACGVEKYKRDLQLLTMALQTISCVDYPFEIETVAYQPNVFKVDVNSFIFDATDYRGVNLSGLKLYDETDNVIAEIKYSYNVTYPYVMVATDTDISSYYGNNIKINNSRQNCLSSEQYSNVVSLINKICDTGYCVDISNPNIEAIINSYTSGTYTYTIAPMTMNVSNIAQQVTITISTTDPWIATTNSDFLSLTGETSGVGNGFVTVWILANPTAYMRTATVDISGISVVINQDPIDY